MKISNKWIFNVQNNWKYQLNPFLDLLILSNHQLNQFPTLNLILQFSQLPTSSFLSSSFLFYQIKSIERKKREKEEEKRKIEQTSFKLENHSFLSTINLLIFSFNSYSLDKTIKINQKRRFVDFLDFHQQRTSLHCWNQLWNDNWKERKNRNDNMDKFDDISKD